MTRSDSTGPTRSASESTWSVLGYARFRHFWIGGAASMTCYWLVEAVCAWEMRLLSNADPFMVSLVTTTLQFTVMAAVIPAGLVADIVDRRKLILFSHVWLAIVLGVIAGLILFEWLTPALLLVFVPAIALTQAVRMPVIGSLITDTVDRPALGAAVALNALGQNASRIIGPAIAGLLLGIGGATVALGIAAVGLLLAGGLLASVVTKRVEPAHQPTLRRMLEDFREERRYLRTTRWKRNLLLRLGGFFACAAVIPALLPVVFQTATTYGLMLSLYGVGAVLSLVVIGRSMSGKAGERRAVVAQCVHAGGLLLLGLSGGSWPAAIALLACGGGWLALSNALMTAAQLQLPAEARGRGLSIVYAVGMGGLAAGGPVWGMIARHFGISTAFVVAGVISLAIVALTRSRRFTVAEEA